MQRAYASPQRTALKKLRHCFSVLAYTEQKDRKLTIQVVQEAISEIPRRLPECRYTTAMSGLPTY